MLYDIIEVSRALKDLFRIVLNTNFKKQAQQQPEGKEK
jgi:hypothetical protein